MNKRESAAKLLTVGHSNRALRDFLNLLKEFQIDRVVDVRKITRSHANPQFNEVSLSSSLAQEGIDYEHLAALGGLRGKTPSVPAELNGNWRNTSFHRYADYALTEPFRQGLGNLIHAGAQQRCVIMCAEVLWWRCHRRIIADHLIAHDCHVQHILGAAQLDEARLTLGAVVREDMTVIYPASVRGGSEGGSKP